MDNILLKYLTHARIIYYLYINKCHYLTLLFSAKFFELQRYNQCRKSLVFFTSFYIASQT